MGAINFAMTDVYGGFAGTTESTIPEDGDQKVLTDEGKTDVVIETKKKLPLYMAFVLVIVLVILMGGVK